MLTSDVSGPWSPPEVLRWTMRILASGKEENLMKKIAIAGMGGSGKTTIVTLLARSLRARGFRVLVVDSEASNPGLYLMLGSDQRSQPLLELVRARRRCLKASRKPQGPPRVFSPRRRSRLHAVSAQ
jgi:Mrp family chromosome partitioning ATPase